MEGLGGFEQVFGEARAVSSDPSLAPTNKILFSVYASDATHLTTCVTDFRSNTWEAVQSIDQLDDLRDNIGVGGSWNEFLDYFASSLRSEDVKLKLDKRHKPDGSISAKLVAQKSKGMPLISINLSKLLENDAAAAIAKFSVELFEAYKSMRESIVKEGSSYKLKKSISEIQSEDARTHSVLHSHEQSKYNLSDGNEKWVSYSNSGLGVSPEKAVTRNKVTNPVVPAYRRAKKRGAILQDDDEAQDD